MHYRYDSIQVLARRKHRLFGEWLQFFWSRTIADQCYRNEKSVPICLGAKRCEFHPQNPGVWPRYPGLEGLPCHKKPPNQGSYRANLPQIVYHQVFESRVLAPREVEHPTDSPSWPEYGHSPSLDDRSKPRNRIRHNKDCLLKKLRAQ